MDSKGNPDRWNPSTDGARDPSRARRHPSCQCSNGPHLECTLLQGWWSDSDLPSNGWWAGVVVPNQVSAPCPECGQPRERHCARIGERRFQVHDRKGVIYSSCNDEDAERVADQWGRKQHDARVIDTDEVRSDVADTMAELVCEAIQGGLTHDEIRAQFEATLSLHGRGDPSGPDLTDLPLSALTALFVPGGPEQQRLNQAVLRELVRRNS